MVFNSLQFLLFFPVVTVLYFLASARYRWMLLLAASCAFYMAFIPSYILILLLTIVIDYAAGIRIEASTGRVRKAFLIGSILSTCAVLFLFKYFDFFAANVSGLAHVLGWNYSLRSLGIILPIGLSFHTFQSLSYVVEVYLGRQKAEKHFGIYALYVMFYPQLVAGPIERPQNLLHQFREVKTFDSDRVAQGLKLMLFGLFKKVVIADRFAVFVDKAYGMPSNFSGFALLLATFLFAFQIYCDFSGYSDIARGAAKVMGFDLMKNFNHPYSSRSIAEFWTRWHISLSTWFKDYVYIPLGGNRQGRWKWYRNLFVTFLISGAWHGANWTYLIWGGLNGGYLLIGIMGKGLRQRTWRILGLDRRPFLAGTISVTGTFVLISIAWVFFRANSLVEAVLIFRSIGGFLVSLAGGHLPEGALIPPQLPQIDLAIDLALIVLLELIQFLQRRGFAPCFMVSAPVTLRWATYYAVLAVIALLGEFGSSRFIYFQF